MSIVSQASAIKAIIETMSVEQKTMVKALMEDALTIEHELSYLKAIFEGSWPNASKILRQRYEEVLLIERIRNRE